MKCLVTYKHPPMSFNLLKKLINIDASDFQYCFVFNIFYVDLESGTEHPVFIRIFFSNDIKFSWLNKITKKYIYILNCKLQSQDLPF